MAKKKRARSIFETLAHTLLGIGAAVGAAAAETYLKTGIGPVAAAALGSAVSSMASAFSPKPNRQIEPK